MSNDRVTVFIWVKEANETQSTLGFLGYLKTIWGEEDIEYNTPTGKYSRCEVTPRDTTWDWVLPVVVTVSVLFLLMFIGGLYLYSVRSENQTKARVTDQVIARERIAAMGVRPSQALKLPGLEQTSQPVRFQTKNFLSTQKDVTNNRSKLWKIV
jgi:hypothetical protein